MSLNRDNPKHSLICLFLLLWHFSKVTQTVCFSCQSTKINLKWNLSFSFRISFKFSHLTLNFIFTIATLNSYHKEIICLQSWDYVLTCFSVLFFYLLGKNLEVLWSYQWKYTHAILLFGFCEHQDIWSMCEAVVEIERVFLCLGYEYVYSGAILFPCKKHVY